jgi:hypothetical protein
MCGADRTVNGGASLPATSIARNQSRSLPHKPAGLRSVIAEGHAHTVIETAGGHAAAEAADMRRLNTVASNVKCPLDGPCHAFKFPACIHRCLPNPSDDSTAASNQEFLCHDCWLPSHAANLGRSGVCGPLSPFDWLSFSTHQEKLCMTGSLDAVQRIEPAADGRPDSWCLTDAMQAACQPNYTGL